MEYVLHDRSGRVINEGDEITSRDGQGWLYRNLTGPDRFGDYNVVASSRGMCTSFYLSAFDVVLAPRDSREYSVVEESSGRVIKRGDILTALSGRQWTFNHVHDVDRFGDYVVSVSYGNRCEIFYVGLFGLLVEEV